MLEEISLRGILKDFQKYYEDPWQSRTWYAWLDSQGCRRKALEKFRAWIQASEHSELPLSSTSSNLNHPLPKPLYLCILLGVHQHLSIYFVFTTAESDAISATANREYVSWLYYSPLFDPGGPSKIALPSNKRCCPVTRARPPRGRVPPRNFTLSAHPLLLPSSIALLQL